MQLPSLALTKVNRDRDRVLSLQHAPYSMHATACMQLLTAC